MTDSPADGPRNAGSARAKGRYPKGIARRQEILDTAIEVFAVRGSQRTSLRAIAQEVGVTHAALSHYFGSLEELLVEVYRESERRGDTDDEDAADTSPAMVMLRSAEVNREVPGLVQLYSTLAAMALEDDHPIAQEFIAARFARLRREIADKVIRLQGAGRLRTDLDPVMVAALVIAASDGLQTQWLLDDAVAHESALALLDRLLRTGDAD
ncbi:MAG: TetR/AcrR family transcriptional regulator [Actinobacteria bacterium]|nr:TetR/AcrR family transcriptional regulator [Actinomycetota bacterium]